MITGARRPSRIVIAGSLALLFAAAGTLFSSTPSQAQFAPAFVTANLNLRAGPDTGYPSVTVIPAGSQVNLLGCLDGIQWCEGTYRGARGWMSARYLQVFDRGGFVSVPQYVRVARVPTVTFDLNVYWDAYYRPYPFYAERARWTPRGIQVSVFYDRLGPDGAWVWYRNQYVWVPRVGRDWRPYVEGRWVYTSTYGWMWVSYEPFGWATYHYGRWAYSDRIGWFWIPGTRWAPAWVAWRHSDGYFAWAPLPPDTQWSVSINVSFGTIPNYYWQVVPARSFLSVDLSAQVIRDRDRVQTALGETRPAGNVTIVNNVVVNNSINVNVVEQATQQVVVVHDVAVTSNAAEAGKSEDATIEIFQPDPQAVPALSEPPQVITVDEAAQQSQTADQAGGEPATEDLVLPPPPPEEPVLPTVVPPFVEAPATEEPAAAPEPMAPLADCPEGTILLDDGSCVTPPPAEPQPLPPLVPPPPPVEEMPAEPAAPAPEPAPELTAPEPTPEEAPQPIACPEGTVMMEGGECLPLCPDSSIPLPDGSCPMDEPVSE